MEAIAPMIRHRKGFLRILDRHRLISRFEVGILLDADGSAPLMAFLEMRPVDLQSGHQRLPGPGDVAEIAHKAKIRKLPLDYALSRNALIRFLTSTENRLPGYLDRNSRYSSMACSGCFRVKS